MIVKYSYLLKKVIVIYTWRDEWVKDRFSNRYDYDAPRVCIRAYSHLSYSWSCSYSKPIGICGKRNMIANDLEMYDIYSPINGCSDSQSELFGIRDLSDMPIYTVVYLRSKKRVQKP